MSQDLIIYERSRSGGLKTRRQWSGKNVDLGLLIDSIGDFFAHKGFTTRKDLSPGEYTLLASPPAVSDVREELTVKVLGDSKDLVVDFLQCEKSRSSILLGYITAMFGGGSFLLKGLKSREALERLEKEFWAYVQDAIVRLHAQLE